MNLIRWVGSKRWMTDYWGGQIVVNHLSATGGSFYEPFLGGGSMAQYVGTRHGANLYLSDVVDPLINYYRVLQKSPRDLFETLNQIAQEYGLDEKAYYAVRDERPDEPLHRAAQFLYLNILGFNGLYRENASGGYNVPCGSRAKEGKIRLPAQDVFESISRSLKMAELECCDFEAAIDMAGHNDFVYCDPPYWDTFADYSKGGFGREEQERLALALHRAGERGAVFLTHNSLGPALDGSESGTRYWYEDFAHIIPIDEPRTVSANGDRAKAPCALITNSNELAEKLRSR